MPTKKKSDTKKSTNVARDLLNEWTQTANDLKKLEEEKRVLSTRLEEITAQLVDMDFSVIESSVDDEKPKSSKKVSKTSKASKTKATKSKTTKSKEEKKTKSTGKKGSKKQAKKPVMIATESSDSNTDSDTDSDSD